MTIGERVKYRRKQLGLTQEELAKRLGNTSRASICTVEKDREDLTTTRIAKLAQALETSPSYLMGWVEDPNPRYNPRELDNMYTDIEIDDEIISEVDKKATLLYEKYLNAPDDVRSVIDRLLESSQSQP